MTKTSIKLFYETLPIIDKNGKITGSVARPIIDVLLNYKHGRIFGPFQSLVDSGADYNLFPSEIAQVLGIKLTKGTLRITQGIGGKTVKAYRHSGIKMFIEDYSFVTSVDFSEEVTVPLLGQQGFFDKFGSIKFLREREELVLEPRF